MHQVLSTSQRFTLIRSVFWSSSPKQGLSPCPFHPVKVRHLLYFLMLFVFSQLCCKTAEAIQFTINDLQAMKACCLIPFNLTSSVILRPSPWPGLSPYPFYTEKVCHLIPFTLTKALIPLILTWSIDVTLSSPPRQGVSLILFTLLRFIILSPSP